MRGIILDFSIQENTGYISGDDGKRYTFLGKEWREEAPPKKGDIVDFDIDLSGDVLKIYKIIQQKSLLNKEELPEVTEAYIAQLKAEEKYGMIAWFKRCMRNYANFSGRARRSEFWYYILATFLIQMIPAIIIGIIVFFIANNNRYWFYNYIYNSGLATNEMVQIFGSTVFIAFVAGWIYSIICSLIFIIPSFAVTVRRLHDIGLSGWWSLLIVATYISPFIPLGGLLVCFPIYILFFVWACTDTKKHANQWGLPAKQ